MGKRIFKPTEFYAVRFDDREFLYGIDDEGVQSTVWIPEAATFHTLASATSTLRRVQALVDDKCFIVNVREYAPKRMHVSRVTY